MGGFLLTDSQFSNIFLFKQLNAHLKCGSVPDEEDSGNLMSSVVVSVQWRLSKGTKNGEVDSKHRAIARAGVCSFIQRFTISIKMVIFYIQHL